jgi:zinc protease
MIRKFFILAGVLLMAHGLNAAAAAPATTGVFNPQIFTLENGMTVALIENHRVPAVVHMVWYKAGAIDEKPSKSGVAHFLEHLMFKGTKTIAEGEFSKRVAKVGGEDNAFTSWDYTAYFQKVATKDLPEMMTMEADRMQNLLLSENAVATENKVIVEERRSVIDNKPTRQFAEQLQAATFLHHPYKTPIIGWYSEMSSLSREDVFDFYNMHYAPNNAVLVIAGDITLPALKELAAKTYGKVPSRTVVKSPVMKEPPQLAARTLEMRLPNVQMPLWRRQYVVPSYATVGQDKGVVDALEVFAQILGGGESSRLYEKLVLKKQIATNVSVYYEAAKRGDSTFVVDVVPVDDSAAGLAAVASAVEAEIAALRTKPVPSEELQRTIRSMQAEAVYARDSLMHPATVVGETLALGLPMSYIEEWPTRIGGVTVERVKAAAALLDVQASATGYLLPAKKK